MKLTTNKFCFELLMACCKTQEAYLVVVKDKLYVLTKIVSFGEEQHMVESVLFYFLNSQTNF